MHNTTKTQLIKDIERDAKELNIKVDINLNSLPTSQVEQLSQAFKDAKK
ncbi:hypothetical protein GTQ43_20880 [Nostoc sp. KVJ3]|nr:hypothetical protein [Nostoc sp. KVJ3]MCW5315620.1 hypothetical protein [Nostoc sp. KVJ3]MCW5316180.1 hypothetical protein [Nostoc sp. KVJ3]